MNFATEPVKIAGYRIEGLLGSGGMSRVYVARQVSLDRRVALKVFELGNTSGGQAAMRLRREAHLLAKLDHENVVRCIDFGEADGYFYLALELVDGESLKHRLDRVGKLSGKDAAKIAYAVGHGLQHAHAKGVVHRDVKPGNVLLSRDGKVKLGDFGLARTPQDSEITQPGTALGTPQYLSPEQARSPRRAGPQSDVYSLGATLYHMVAGVTPHAGETLAEVVTAILFETVTPPEAHSPDLDPGLSRIIACAMAKDRALRYRSALELNADLARWLAGQADTTVGISWDEAGAAAEEPLRPPVKAALAGGAVLIAALAGYVVWSDSRETPMPPPIVSSLPNFDSVADGRVSLAAAHAAWLAAPSTDSARAEFETRLREEIRLRSTILARAVAAFGRAEVGAGRFTTALASFDAEVKKRAEATFGGVPDSLHLDILSPLVDQTGPARDELTDLVHRTQLAVAERIKSVVDAALEPASEALEQRKFDVVEAAIVAVESRLELLVRDGILRGIREVVPEAHTIQPPASWLQEAIAGARARCESTRSAIDIQSMLAEWEASQRLEAFAVEEDDPASDAEIAERARAVVVIALGGGASLYPARWPALEKAVEARVAEIIDERRTRRDAMRTEREAEWIARVADSLARGDASGALTVVPPGDRAAIQDPWLAALVAAALDLDAAQLEALRGFEGAMGRRERVATKGLVKEGTVARVDRSARRVSFTDPAFEVAMTELPVAELERRAAAAVTPRLRAVVAILAADVAAARQALKDSDFADWAVAARRITEELAVAEAARERGEVSAAEALLARFDEALAANDRATAAELADELLKSPAAGRLPAVKSRRLELQRVRKEGQAALELERKRTAIRTATKATVVFEAGGETLWRYAFDDPAQLDDFELPGSEWQIVGGRLGSLGLLDRSDLGSRIDLFRNRPGLRRSLPFTVDSLHGVRAEFELVLPLDPPPGLIGVRVLSTCFVIRNFAEPGVGGQVNAWIGELDDFRDHLFDPSLGETRPKKPGGGIRPFATERGSRYRFVITGRGGADAEWILEVEGEIAHRFRPGIEPRGTGLEIRVEMPCEIEELSLRGHVPGLK
jgi:Protein kinase domain